jgi:hypothetical protein
MRPHLAERGLIDDLTEKLEQLERRTPFYIGEKARAVIEDMKLRDMERKRTREQDRANLQGQVPNPSA